MTTRRVVTVVGARPQFIKASVVSAALRRVGIEEFMVHTGQHGDHAMSGAFFEELGIPGPGYNLGLSGGGHGDMLGRMLQALEPLLIEVVPPCVVVYGDTNSTLAGALAAAKLHIPVAHVEAGLRSFNRRMPEEINRVLTDHVSDLLACPTRTAVANLAAEGVSAGVHHTGDVMFDAYRLAIERGAHSSSVLKDLGLTPNEYQVATVHRAENTDDPEQLRRVLAFLGRASAASPVVLPLHPRTAGVLRATGLAAVGVRLVPPLGYVDMATLVRNAACVLTDSGGLQKEAYFAGVPCITLRDESEWPETIQSGWNRLWTSEDWATPQQPIDDYGDGRAADRFVALLENLLG